MNWSSQLQQGRSPLRSRSDFKGRSSKKSRNDETWYDLEYDRELIVQSIAKQYHILPSDQEVLHYSDWYQLVSGLMPDTPLGQIVRIRSEDDKKIIEHFGANEKRIRQEWSQFRSSQAADRFSEQDKINAAEYFERLFASMFGTK